MKFVCDRCQTRYSIADDKVKQRIVRIRCKTCDNVITVHGRHLEDSAGEAEEAANDARQDSGARVAASSLGRSSGADWHVAVDGSQKGPFTVGEAAKLIASLPAGRSVHVWKAGFDGWKPPKEVPAIVAELTSLRRLSSAPTGSVPKRAPALGSGPKAPPRALGSSPKVPPSAVGSAIKAAPSSRTTGSRTTAPPPVPAASGLKPATNPGGTSPKAAVPNASGAVVPRPTPNVAPSSPVRAPSAAHPASDEVATAFASFSGDAEFGEGAKTKADFGDQVQTKSEKARVASEAPAAPPVAEPDEFAEGERTPPPMQPLPPVVAQLAQRPSSAPTAAPSPQAMSPQAVLFAQLDLAVPQPPPAQPGPFFPAPDTFATDVPVTPAAEAGLSQMTGLAGITHRHQGLKYVIGLLVVVVLVILIALLSWRMDAKRVDNDQPPPAERAAALAVANVANNDEEARTRQEAERMFKSVVAPTHEPSREAPSATRSGARRNAGAHAATRAPAAPPRPAGVSAEDVQRASGTEMASVRPLGAADSQRARSGAPKEVSQEQIIAVVKNKDHQVGIKTCYERALRHDGRARAGRLDVVVSIGSSGIVQNVQVNGPSDFSQVMSCIKSAVRHWAFPPKGEEYATSFPLILQGS